mgnify:CR=1 FL=1
MCECHSLKLNSIADVALSHWSIGGSPPIDSNLMSCRSLIRRLVVVLPIAYEIDEVASFDWMKSGSSLIAYRIVLKFCFFLFYPTNHINKKIGFLFFVVHQITSNYHSLHLIVNS